MHLVGEIKLSTLLYVLSKRRQFFLGYEEYLLITFGLKYYNFQVIKFTVNISIMMFENLIIL